MDTEKATNPWGVETKTVRGNMYLSSAIKLFKDQDKNKFPKFGISSDSFIGFCKLSIDLIAQTKDEIDLKEIAGIFKAIALQKIKNHPEEFSRETLLSFRDKAGLRFGDTLSHPSNLSDIWSTFAELASLKDK